MKSNDIVHELGYRTKGLRYRIIKYLIPNIGWMLETNFRPMIRFLKKHFDNKPLVGVEVGVDIGVNALNILRNLNMTKLFLIDSYLPYYQDERYIDDSVHSFTLAKQRLHKFNSVLEWVKKISCHAVDDIPTDVDFVYIDGNHDYNHVKQDINLYYPKVKANGVVGGHDFNGTHLGLSKAVIEFVSSHKLKCCGWLNDWWFVK